jgi:hypothetical protein
MDITFRIIAYLLGFAVYSETGNFLFCLGICLSCALILSFFKSEKLILGYAGIGILSSVHATNLDYFALVILSASLMSLNKNSPEFKSRNLGLIISAGLILTSIATEHIFILFAGLGSLVIASDFYITLKYQKWLRVFLIGLYGILILPVPYLRSGESVYLEQGKWATDSGDYGKLNEGLELRNETTYSYTWMIRLIANHKGKVLSLNSNDSTAWLVTPTRTFTAEEIEHLNSWVYKGGRLIVVADHTDYVGHAICLNKITQPIGLEIGIGTFMPELDKIESSQSFIGDEALTKTPTIATSIGAVPILTSKGYFEDPDYSKPGFFGPCTPSKDDRYGRQMTGGVIRHGLGTLIFWGDSTLFSNFSIFQPDSIKILELLNSRDWVIIIPYVCFFLLTFLLLRMLILAYFIPLILVLYLICFAPKTNLLSKYKNTAWAGDRNLVDDKYDPKASFSTLFSLSSATGSIPRWTDHPESEVGGIWVSENPPPAGNWRWISPFLSVKLEKNNIENPWDKLVSFVNSEARYTLSIPAVSSDKFDAGGVWTNEGIGSWWFGVKTSPARITKITAGLNWIITGNMNWSEPSYAQTSGPAKPCRVYIDNGKQLKLELPRINAKPGEYVYLGAGVSALVTVLDGKVVLTGARDKDCFGYANSMKQASWVLIYDEDMKAK